MLNHPIIRREFIGMLRTRRAFGVLCALVAAMVALVLVRWPSGAVVDLQGAAARQVLRVFGYGMTASLMLLSPIFPATSIVKEKVQGTLALLLNSPLHPWSIVLGKLVGAVGFILLMLVMSLPAAAALFAMGGVDLTGQLPALYLVLLMLSLMYATLGLLVSSFAQTTESSLRITYGLVLLLGVITLIPHQFLQNQAWVGDSVRQAADWVRCVSPLPAMMAVMGDLSITSGGLAEIGGQVQRFVILAGISSLLCTGWCAWRMNQKLFDRSREAGKITDDRSTAARAYRRVMYLWFFDPQRRSGMIGRWTNPVLVKEQRCRRFGRGNWMMRLIGLCLIVSLLLMLASALGSAQKSVGAMGGIMVVLQASLILLITPSLSGGLIAAEIESRGWQLLQMTPLRAFTIVSGKLLSVLVTLSLVLLATLPAYAALIFIDPAQWIVAVQVIATLALLALLALLVSAAASSLFPSTAAASATSYALLMLLCAGTMLFWLGEDAPFSHSTVQNVLRLNPLAAALRLIDAPGFARYELLPWNWLFTGAMCVACLIVLVTRVWRLTRPR